MTTSSIAVRGVAVLGLLSVAGCSAERQARSDREAVRAGMTKQEVRAALGGPAKITPGEGERPAETWTYVYGAEGDSLEVFSTIVTVLGAVGTVVAVMFGSGGWNTGPPPVKKADHGSVWRLTVVFDSQGRVADISEAW